MEKDKIIVGISHGDINGIGYEVILKALLDPRLYEICTPVIYGSPKVAAYHRKALDIDNFSLTTINKIEELHHKKPSIINCVDDEVRVELGKSTPGAGEASRMALEAAVKDLRDGKIDALVTAPINKHNVQSHEFTFSGHTEYLQYVFQSDEVVMLMVSELMKIGVVAGHIPISRLSSFITTEMILDKLKIMSKALHADFGIRKPKIAVLGLNPHAGDQ